MLPSMKLDLWERVFSQVQRVDYDENFSPVAILKSVGIMLELVVFFNYEIWQMDVKTSFLTSFREERFLSKELSGRMVET